VINVAQTFHHSGRKKILRMMLLSKAIILLMLGIARSDGGISGSAVSRGKARDAVFHLSALSQAP
jgi:multisubunit Na+/H+ antiporter MnhC subunit